MKKEKPKYQPHSLVLIFLKQKKKFLQKIKKKFLQESKKKYKIL